MKTRFMLEWKLLWIIQRKNRIFNAIHKYQF